MSKKKSIGDIKLADFPEKVDSQIKSLTLKDKAILMGLFLAKFDQEALESFGFKTFKEDFNVLGYSVKTPPSSIKNYRDEFDRFFPNPRKGWNRPFREFYRDLLTQFGALGFDDFYKLINSFVLDDYVDIKDIKAKRTPTKERKFLANRLLTGKAAEEYFVMNYHAISPFQSCQLIDATNMGCGFDYKLFFESDNYYVEVKGINERHGGILMTEKEYNTAEDLLEKYCLFVVSNFQETPIHQLFFDPIHCEGLSFQRQERQIIQISYSSNI